MPGWGLLARNEISPAHHLIASPYGAQRTASCRESECSDNGLQQPIYGMPVVPLLPQHKYSPDTYIWTLTAPVCQNTLQVGRDFCFTPLLLSCPSLSPWLGGLLTVAGACARLLGLPMWRARCHKRQVSLLISPIPHVSVLDPLIIVGVLLRMLLASNMLLPCLHSRTSMVSSMASLTFHALGSAVQPIVCPAASGRAPLASSSSEEYPHTSRACMCSV